MLCFHEKYKSIFRGFGRQSTFRQRIQCNYIKAREARKRVKRSLDYRSSKLASRPVGCPAGPETVEPRVVQPEIAKTERAR